MLKVIPSGLTKSYSHPFHIGCLKVEDDEVDIVANFLESAPQKFK